MTTTDRKGRPATGVFGAHEDYTTLENRAWLHRQGGGLVQS